MPCSAAVRARILTIAVIATALLLSPGASWGVTLAKLREQARQAITKKLVSVDPPHLSISKGELQYYLGGAGYFFAEQFHNQLLGQALANQIQIELLRRAPHRVLGDDFWNPVFASSEKIIDQQLSLIDGPGDTLERRQERMQELTEQIWKGYEDAFQREAKRRGLTVIPMAAGQGAKQVALKTDPPDCRVFLMHALEKQLSDLDGRTPQWRQIEDPSSVMVDGVYWYAWQVGQEMKVGKQMIDFNRNPEQFEYTLR